MLWSTKRLEGARIRATDGEIGHVEQFYFDDRNWRITYVVTSIGSWLHHKLVLMSPEAITSIQGPQDPMVNVALTTSEVRRSLDAQTHRPVSLQQPHDYYLYLGLPHYLNVAVISHPDANPQADPHLRSTKIVRHYHVMASDGEIAHLEGFIIDDETWTIRYATADTRDWWHRKKMLLATEWIDLISWAESNVYVGFTRERIGNSPEFHPEQPLTREFEIGLYNYYERTPYWAPTKGR
jgi:hypothetical protein